MRRYGRRVRSLPSGRLVIRKRVEYVHDCAIECPTGHVRWPNVVLHATDIAVLVPFNVDAARN